MTILVRLYSKPGCHLCEQAQADLARLKPRHPHQLELIDISESTELFARYGERIPVLEIAGDEFGAPLAAADIERALVAAAASRQKAS